MDARRQRWLPGFLLRRWWHVFWIGPLVGLITGAVLVLGFQRANQTDTRYVIAGILPWTLDTNRYIEVLSDELEGDETLIKVRQEIAERGGHEPPLWWLRDRIKVDREYEGKEELLVRFAHPSQVEMERMMLAFGTVAEGITKQRFEEFRAEWVIELDEEIRVLRRQRDEFIRSVDPDQSDGWPLSDRLYEVEGSREALGWQQKYVGSVVRSLLPGSYGPGPRYGWTWDTLAPWVILVGKCTGYGLLAAFPAVFLLEAVRPRR